jgi:hypothetical protein
MGTFARVADKFMKENDEVAPLISLKISFLWPAEHLGITSMNRTINSKKEPKP